MDRACGPNFWELPLAELDQNEWEALCDGCGRCCLHKIEDEDSGEIAETNVACTLLDTRTAQCRDYAHRKAFVPDCLRLTLKIVDSVEWLPSTCAYRRRAANAALAALALSHHRRPRRRGACGGFGGGPRGERGQGGPARAPHRRLGRLRAR